MRTRDRYARVQIILHWLAVILIAAAWVLRLALGAPRPPEADPAWQKKVANITHWLLYALGIFGPWAGGFAFYLRLEAAAEIHETLITLLLVVAAAHTGAAVYHHYVVRDGVLQRMVPWIKAR